MWKVAQESLEEQNEADPLVPGVPDLIPILGDLNQVGIVGVNVGLPSPDTRVSHMRANPASDLRRDGEGALDPAVRVHDVYKKML